MTDRETNKASSKKMKPGMKIAAKAKESAMKGAQKLINQLPKAVEKSPFLQNTLTMIMEMQQQAKSIKKDANEEVHKLLEVIQHSYHDIEVQARKVGGEAKKQAKDSVHQLLEKWEAKKGTLPKKFVGEMDNLLNQVGLGKKSGSAKPVATARKTSVTKKTAAKSTTKAAAPKKPSSVKKVSAVKSKEATGSKMSGSKKTSIKTPIKKVVPPVMPN